MNEWPLPMGEALITEEEHQELIEMMEHLDWLETQEQIKDLESK